MTDTRPDDPGPNLHERVDEAAAFLRARAPAPPEVAIVLGSGLGPLADQIEDSVSLPFADIPHFPESTVEGHHGRIVLGQLRGKPVIALQGRLHLYEGYAPEVVTFPIRVFRALEVAVLLLSNAAGGLNRQFATGDLMLVEDHINFTLKNPLIGGNDPELGPRFPDLSEPYSPRLRSLAREVGRAQALPIREGILTAVHGPHYETQAELRMLRRAGADAVGMSVIPEVIVAKHAGIAEVLAITCITDMATGEDGEAVSHEQVLAAAKAAEAHFVSLVQGVLDRL